MCEDWCQIRLLFGNYTTELLHPKISLLSLYKHWSQGRIQGGVLGVKPLSFLGNFSNVLGFFNKKIPKPPLKFPVHTEKFQNPSLKKFLNTPLIEVPFLIDICYQFRNKIEAQINLIFLALISFILSIKMWT